MRILTIILVAGLIGFVAGCSQQAANEESKEDELQEQEQTEKEEAEIEKERLEQEKQKEEEKPAVVDVVDPETKEIIKTFFPEEMGFGSNNEQYQQALEAWARDTARGTEETEGYDQRMILDRIGPNGEIIKGTPQKILEEAELTEKILNASESGGTVELPLYITHSDYKAEEVSQLDEVVVASYTTHYNNGVAGRSKNIELSAEAINNVILGVGDHFSFNTTVGPSDEAHGYQPAPEAINGKLVMGIGGGICQTSSTLFNAVDKLGVDYVERHNHSVNVGYVPKGRDATVSYGGVDFRFKNTTGVPLLLKAYANKGALTVEVRTSKVNNALINKS